jgi:hypothetical protein
MLNFLRNRGRWAFKQSERTHLAPRASDDGVQDECPSAPDVTSNARVRCDAVAVTGAVGACKAGHFLVRIGARVV